jgi:hypothetical protein
LCKIDFSSRVSALNQFMLVFTERTSRPPQSKRRTDAVTALQIAASRSSNLQQGFDQFLITRREPGNHPKPQHHRFRAHKKGQAN